MKVVVGNQNRIPRRRKRKEGRLIRVMKKKRNMLKLWKKRKKMNLKKNSFALFISDSLP